MSRFVHHIDHRTVTTPMRRTTERREKRVSDTAENRVRTGAMNERELDVLIERIRGGDSGAFGRLVAALEPFVSGSSFKVCRDREIADENVQDTFVNVYRKLHQFDGSSKFTTWLYSIILNNCRMKRRRRLIDQATLSTDDVGEPAVERAQAKRSAEFGADRSLLLDELQAVLDRSVDELPEELRSVLMLRDLEELSTEETAAALGLTEAAVKSRLHRARVKVRARIENYLNG